MILISLSVVWISTTGEHVKWTGFVNLGVGDEVRIRVIETDAVDKPRVRESSLIARLTESARRVLHFSVAEGRRYGGGDSVDTEHLLIALLREPPEWLAALGLPTVECVREQVKEHFGERDPKKGDLPLSSQSRRVLQIAAEEADSMSEQRIGFDHLLIGLLREEEGYGGRLLRNSGVDLQMVRSKISGTRPIKGTTADEDAT